MLTRVAPLMALACLLGCASQSSEDKAAVARMSPFELQMWAQVKCDRCRRLLDAKNPKDGIYKVGDTLMTLHGSCASLIPHPTRRNR